MPVRVSLILSYPNTTTFNLSTQLLVDSVVHRRKVTVPVFVYFHPAILHAIEINPVQFYDHIVILHHANVLLLFHDSHIDCCCWFSHIKTIFYYTHSKRPTPSSFHCPSFPQGYCRANCRRLLVPSALETSPNLHGHIWLHVPNGLLHYVPT